MQEETIGTTGLGITTDKPPRQLSPYALGLIADFESWVPKPYDDASQYCTIGFGHLVAKAPCVLSTAQLSGYRNPLSMNEGKALLSKDTALASGAVSKLVKVNLTDKQFDALSSFVFNVGSQNFMHSSLLQYINAEDFQSASRQFGRWIKSKDVVLDGLVSRRACEAALFRGDIPTGSQELFSRKACSSLGAAPDSASLIDVLRGER